MRKRLMNAGRPVSFVQDELVKNGQDLFAVLVDSLQSLPKTGFIPGRVAPFLEKRARYVNVPAQGVGRMASKEEAIEHGGLPLRG
jgi:hypothetical protein